MATTSDFRSGMIFRMDGELYSLVEFQHVKMARGAAFTRAKIKSMESGKVLEKTFRGSDKVEEVRVERRNMQFLYREGDLLVCMDNQTYDQLSVEADMMEPGTDFLKEGEQVSVLLDGDTPVAAEMPTFVELEVTETDPGLKGDTVSGTTKPATVETGGQVQVPLFMNVGDKIKIDTRSNTYLERVNK